MKLLLLSWKLGSSKDRNYKYLKSIYDPVRDRSKVYPKCVEGDLKAAIQPIDLEHFCKEESGNEFMMCYDGRLLQCYREKCFNKLLVKGLCTKAGVLLFLLNILL